MKLHQAPGRAEGGRISSPHMEPRNKRSRLRPLLPGAIEISQVGGRLILPRRRQVSVRAHHVVLLSDLHMVVVLGASDLAPIGLAIGLAMVALGYDPRTRQRM